MDILVTFDDGTTELRAANSPALVQPANMHDVTSLGYRRIGPIALASTRDVCSQMPLHVWRITGGLGKGEPLTGEWCHCKVETVEEQIARLTRERDAVITQRDEAREVARRLLALETP